MSSTGTLESSESDVAFVLRSAAQLGQDDKRAFPDYVEGSNAQAGALRKKKEKKRGKEGHVYSVLVMCSRDGGRGYKG